MTEREEMDELTRLLREEYNAPPPVPREEMWAVIESGLDAEDATVVSLDEVGARRSTVVWRRMGWAVAATVVLGLGVGIGRMTAPEPETLAEAPVAGGARSALRMAALEHLGRTEALLRMVRADERSGQGVDPAVGSWARTLLTQTRLLLDSSEAEDVRMRELLEDLELVLVQIAAVSDVEGDPARVRSEMDLALDGLERREVLPRIQAVVPGLAGT